MNIITRLLIILYDVIFFDATRQNILKIKHKSNVTLPNKIFLGRYTDFDVNQDIKGITLGENFYCRRFCNFTVKSNAQFKVGNNVFFNNYCAITCIDSITIGDNTMFGEGVKIYDHNHGIIKEKGEVHYQKEQFTSAPISIGKNCWIASNVVILKGVTIGDNVVIGANCLIYKSIPSNSIVKSKQELIIQNESIIN